MTMTITRLLLSTMTMGDDDGGDDDDEYDDDDGAHDNDNDGDDGYVFLAAARTAPIHPSAAWRPLPRSWPRMASLLGCPVSAEQVVDELLH